MTRKRMRACRGQGRRINWRRASLSLSSVLRHRRIARVDILYEIGSEGGDIIYMHATSAMGRRVSLERPVQFTLHRDVPTAYCTLREALEDWLWTLTEIAARAPRS